VAVALVYPPSLPTPSELPIQSVERRALSGGSPFEARELQRDRGARVQVVWPPLDDLQAEVLESWGRVTLKLWGAWFLATWPLPQGRVPAVRRFLAPPARQYVPGGFWRYTATMELRGAGEPPFGHDDDVVMLLHMDALPFVDEVGREVTMTGSDITIDSDAQFDNAAFWGSSQNSLATMVNDEKMDFGRGPGPTFDVWLRGLPSLDHDNMVFAVSKSVANGQYAMAALCANMDGGSAHYSVFVSPITAGDAFLNSGAPILLHIGPVPGTSYNHIRFGRCNDRLWALAVDGNIVDTYLTAPGLEFNGSIGTDHGLTWVGYNATSPPFFLGYPWSSNPMDELVARKRWMDTSDFVVPAIRFEYP